MTKTSLVQGSNSLLTLFARFVRGFLSQGRMRAIGIVGGRYFVSATKRWDIREAPLVSECGRRVQSTPASWFAL
jgi:hypothetical protein